MDEKKVPEESPRATIQELINRCKKMETELDELKKRLAEMTRQAEKGLKRRKDKLD